jgi:hypothetical protein
VPGQAGEAPRLVPLLDRALGRVAVIDEVVADKGFDGDRLREQCLERDVNPNIPLKANRDPGRWAWDEEGYRRRNRVSLRPGFAVEAAGPPRFLGNPCERVLLADPGGIADVRPLRRRDAAFRSYYDVGSREVGISGLHHTTRSLAISASQPGSPRDHARLASGCWPGSAGRGWLPAGFR